MSGIPVFLASDDNYAPFVATTMASICANTKSFIEFYILEDRITDKNKRKIKKTAGFFKNFSVEFISVNTELYFRKLKVKYTPHISMATYSRLLIPEVKPGIQKAIYTDIDVAFTADISELYQTQLKGYYLAAVTSYNLHAIEHYQKATARLELKNFDSIFNAGLLIIDCDKWRNLKISEQLVELAEKLESEGRLQFNDQDTLNKFFDGDYLPLDKTWNVMHKLLETNFSETEIKSILSNHKMAHYTGPDMFKPWNNKNLKGAEHFWKYVPYTAFSKDIEKINFYFNNPGMVKHYRRKYLNMLIKLLVSKKKYRKLKKNPALFFGDSKNNFIKFLGRLYL